ncbi:acyltransferase family protein [Salinimonas sediminis]|uniref:Acyltransferase n=1 Tax=Salinimonas sediminis TaxID=2303538 RepID=A0A346NKE2_9ALTE|nr:acyltransferase family protein [Salinimonas sediminis]AXR05999.1 acyltransferase [Salinimonas sediminis]
MTQSTSRGYIPAIDGLRALAVLAVMVFHLDASLLPGGFTGVDIFFVISGYVVARSLSGHQYTAFQAYIVAFYRRRILRLFPALLACLLVCTAIVVLFIPQAWLSQSISHTGLGAFFGVSNLVLAANTQTYFSPSVEFNPFVHTWSLGVEEQFYVVFPILMYWYLKGRARYATAMLAILSLAASWYYSNTNLNASYYLLTSRFWELAAGALLFQWQAKQRTPTFTLPPLPVAGLLITGAGLWLASKEAFPVPWAILPVVGTVLLLHSFSTPQAAGSVSRIFCLPALRYIGKISYSLYLWHWPVYTFFRWSVGLETPLQWLAAFSLTFIPAMLSYHLLEQRLPRRPLLQHMVAWKTVAAGLVVISVSGAGAYWGFNNQPKIKISNTNDKYNWYPYYSHPTDLPSGNELSGRTIYVIGDSHAGAYGTMLRMLADETGIQTEIHSQGGCGAANMREPVLVDDNACAAKLQRWLHHIQQNATDNDIVFFATLKAYRLTNQYRITPKPKPQVVATMYSKEAEQARDAAMQETLQIMRKIAAVTPHIITDAPKPVFSYIPFRCSDWFNQDNPTCESPTHQDRAFMESFREPVMQNLDTVQQHIAQLTVWDPLPALCNKTRCPVYDNNTPLYFDADHLSAHGNRVLYPSFKQAIMQMVHSQQAASPPAGKNASG